MTAKNIINALGGYKAVADALGIPKTTVHAWVRTNSIPSWRRVALLELALRKGIDLAHRDFPERAANVCA